MRRSAIKSALFAEQHGLCTYCGIDMTRRKEFGLEHRQATIDHIIASSNLGLDDPVNMTLCCLHCNRHKRSHTVATLRRMADVMERLIFERGLSQS